MEKIKIEFKTHEVPAPFAHQYSLTLTIDEEIKAAYEIKYLGREDIAIEEILAEGFSEEDDFEWKGIIDASWKESILSLSQTKSQKDLSEFNEFTQTELIISRNDESETHRFYDHEELEYNVQEIVQALFETSKKESPLHIYLLKGQDQKKYEFKLSFAKRSCTISQKGKTIKQMTWENGKSFLSLVYQPAYQLNPSKPTKNGVFISFDENEWYSVNKIEEVEDLIGFESRLLEFI